MNELGYRTSMPIDTTSEEKARLALAANPFPPTPLLDITDEGIVIATGFSEALHRLLRWVPNARWRAAQRSWLVPYSGAEAVRAVLPEIIRLADAARDLDDAPSPSPTRRADAWTDGRDRLGEAAELLFGSDWKAALAHEYPDTSLVEWIEGAPSPAPGDLVFTDLASALRRKAEIMKRAAERLEAPRPSAGP